MKTKLLGKIALFASVSLICNRRTCTRFQNKITDEKEKPSLTFLMKNLPTNLLMLKAFTEQLGLKPIQIFKTKSETDKLEFLTTNSNCITKA
jgi:hypothetical protein